jgi:uncharacterized phage-associated protein
VDQTGLFLVLRYSVRSVANAFLDLAERDGMPLDPVKLQMLVYIAHGISLAEDGHGLVREPACAWPQGAVFPDLFEALYDVGARPVPPGRRAKAFDPLAAAFLPAPPPQQADAQGLIREVWQALGSFDRHRLALIVFHAPEAPWHRALRSATGKHSGAAIIAESAIAQQFRFSGSEMNHKTMLH